MDTILKNPHFVAMNSTADLKRKLMTKRDVVVRVYICKLIDIIKKDTFSLSDPYVKLRIGNQVIDDSDNYLDNQRNCFWGRSYE